MRRDGERVVDVHEAIEAIERYASRGREALDRDELIQTWMLHHLGIIGEACRAISPQFREKHPEVPWSKVIGLRNVLVHEYFGVDLDIVWSVVQNELPRLKEKVEAILRETE